MVTIKPCIKCGLKKDGMLTPEGMCRECYQGEQDEEDRRAYINTSMPGGIVARWNGTPSFLDKKRNYMYLRIPDTQNHYFDPEKEYEIIVLEAST